MGYRIFLRNYSCLWSNVNRNYSWLRNQALESRCRSNLWPNRSDQYEQSSNPCGETRHNELIVKTVQPRNWHQTTFSNWNFLSAYIRTPRDDGSLKIQACPILRFFFQWYLNDISLKFMDVLADGQHASLSRFFVCQRREQVTQD